MRASIHGLHLVYLQLVPCRTPIFIIVKTAKILLELNLRSPTDVVSLRWLKDRILSVNTCNLARPEPTGRVGIDVNSIRTTTNNNLYTCTFLRPLEVPKNGLQFNINDQTEWNVLIAKGRIASNNDQVARHGFFANDRRIHQNVNFFRSPAVTTDSLTDAASDGTVVTAETTTGKILTNIIS